jgi:hypothetical protein
VSIPRALRRCHPHSRPAAPPPAFFVQWCHRLVFLRIPEHPAAPLPADLDTRSGDPVRHRRCHRALASPTSRYAAATRVLAQRRRHRPSLCNGATVSYFFASPSTRLPRILQSLIPGQGTLSHAVAVTARWLPPHHATSLPPSFSRKADTVGQFNAVHHAFLMRVPPHFCICFCASSSLLFCAPRHLFRTVPQHFSASSPIFRAPRPHRCCYHRHAQNSNTSFPRSDMAAPFLRCVPPHFRALSPPASIHTVSDLSMNDTSITASLFTPPFPLDPTTHGLGAGRRTRANQHTTTSVRQREGVTDLAEGTLKGYLE